MKMDKKNKFSRKGVKRPTQKEYEERVNEAQMLLMQGPILKSAVIAHIKSKFKVEHRAAETYLARARQNILLHLNQLKDEHRADSLAFYEGIILDPDTSAADRLRARERIDKLLGLDKPSESLIKLNHSGEIKQTGVVSVDQLKLPLALRKQILAAMRAQNPSETDPATSPSDPW